VTFMERWHIIKKGYMDMPLKSLLEREVQVYMVLVLISLRG